eukprot:scaffold1085_cov407-Prasinococcus_capsulatus_cf.AAC.16
MEKSEWASTTYRRDPAPHCSPGPRGCARPEPRMRKARRSGEAVVGGRRSQGPSTHTHAHTHTHARTRHARPRRRRREMRAASAPFAPPRDSGSGTRWNDGRTGDAACSGLASPPSALAGGPRAAPFGLVRVVVVVVAGWPPRPRTDGRP